MYLVNIFRSWRYEQELQSLLWKINLQDLKIVHLSSQHVEAYPKSLETLKVINNLTVHHACINILYPVHNMYAATHKRGRCNYIIPESWGSNWSFLLILLSASSHQCVLQHGDAFSRRRAETSLHSGGSLPWTDSCCETRGEEVRRSYTERPQRIETG